jgi:hypothetical protein
LQKYIEINKFHGKIYIRPRELKPRELKPRELKPRDYRPTFIQLIIKKYHYLQDYWH